MTHTSVSIAKNYRQPISLECLHLLDALEDALDEVGLFLNVNKTNDAQFREDTAATTVAGQNRFVRTQMVGVHFLHG